MLESARDDHDMPFNFVQPLLGIRIGIWMRIDPGNRCVCVCVRVHNLHACMLRRRTLHACRARMHTCTLAPRARTSGSSAEVPRLTAGRGDYPPRPRGRRFGSPPLAGQLALLSSPKVGSNNFLFFFWNLGAMENRKTSWTWHQNRSVWDEAASPGSLISMGT